MPKSSLFSRKTGEDPRSIQLKEAVTVPCKGTNKPVPHNGTLLTAAIVKTRDEKDGSDAYRTSMCLVKSIYGMRFQMPR